MPKHTITNTKTKNEGKLKGKKLKDTKLKTKKYKININDVNSNLEDDNSNLEDDNSNLEDVNSNLEDDNSNLEDDNSNLEDDNSNLEDDNSNLEDDNSNLEDVKLLKECIKNKLTSEFDKLNLEEDKILEESIKEKLTSEFDKINLENIFDYQTDSFKVCDAYFKMDNGKQLIAHHFKSFEQFIEKYLADIFEQFNPIEIFQEYDINTNKYKFELYISFENYYIKPPTITELDGETIEMTPNIARLRNLTYSSQLYVNVRMKRVIRYSNPSNIKANLDIEDVKEMILPDIKFGKLPIMVQSKYCYLSKFDHCMTKQLGECEYDLGGYFIVKGNEKVIVGQERIAGNKIFVFNQQKQNKSREFESEVRSCKDNTFSMVMTNIVKFNETNQIFTVDIPTFKNPINIFIIMKLCGFDNDKDLLESICWDIEDKVIGNELSISLKQTLIHYKNIFLSEKIKTRDDLINYCLKHCKFKNMLKDYKMTEEDKIKYLFKSLEDDFLPHINNDLFKKGYYLALMTRKLIMVILGLVSYDDRDSFENKRVETTGHLLAGLFRSCLKRLVKEIQKGINKELNNKNILKNIGSKKPHSDIFDIINSDNIYKIIKATSIESGIKYSLATGNWGVKTNGIGKQKVGTAQLLNRLGYNSYLSYMRRVICPSDKNKKNNKIVGPRKLHASQFGYICPAETPEGGQVGIVKNMALSATITNQYDSSPLKEWLKKNGIKDIPHKNLNANTGKMNTLKYDTIIMVNGCIMGFHSNIKDVVFKFLEDRRSGIIHPYTSIRWNIEINECTFYTDAGRLIRPVLVVDSNNKLRITKEHITHLDKCNGDFNSLLMPKQFIHNYNINNNNFNNNFNNDNNNINDNDDNDDINDINDINDNDDNKINIKFTKGVIDFIDNEELNMCCIAMKPEYLIEGNVNCKHTKSNYSHCEIHPGLMLGVLACVIPFSDHSQSPRNAYQSSMGKQAMNIYLTNYLQRLDTQSYILNNIEKAIVRSNFGKYVNYNALPPGMNAMVAIACYSGYNQEDSIIMNKHSIDMGMFRTTYYHVYKDEEKKIQSNGKEEKFCKPDPSYTKGIKPGNYDKLDDRGFIKVNEYVSSKDVIIGKKLPVKNKFKNGEQIYEDCSTTIRMNENGFIDKVYVHRNESGYMCGKVRIRNERIPIVGSKLASRVGQKGICGMRLPQEDMPYTKDGLVPDIIMTPQAIPSRMTIGQLLECLLGKISAHCGGFSSCTPFDKINANTLGKILENHGFDYHGDEILYSGITGKQMDVKIFFGPTYYQRLKHMVEDKMHSRASGPVVLLTRQPAEGRARDGGLRIGEMEKDVFNAHGTLSFMKERLMDVSDKFDIYVCSQCGNQAIVNADPEIQKYECKSCNNFSDFKHLQIPYASKLMMQELRGMNMNLTFKV